jgi:hypothetical protein
MVSTTLVFECMPRVTVLVCKKYYNFVRIHAALRMTPAMAAGVTGKLWEIGDIVALIEAKEAEQPAVRGPYKERIAG